MGKKIYLGGASAELELVMADAARLEAAGHTITEPWWKRVLEVRAQGFAHDADVPDDYMRESAERNEDGIRDAEIALFRCRTTPEASRRAVAGGFSSGMGYELGVAKAEVRERARMRRGLARNTSYDDMLPKQAAELVRKLSEPLSIWIYGNAARFVGIWTPPYPVRFESLDAVLRTLAGL